MVTNSSIQKTIALLIATASLGTCVVADAQTTQHRSILHRHAGAVAGVAAYAAAKHTGRRRVAYGRRRNFAQRHPIMTGVAAGAVAHHWAKKH